MTDLEKVQWADFLNELCDSVVHVLRERGEFNLRDYIPNDRCVNIPIKFEDILVPEWFDFDVIIKFYEDNGYIIGGDAYSLTEKGIEYCYIVSFYWKLETGYVVTIHNTELYEKFISDNPPVISDAKYLAWLEAGRLAEVERERKSVEKRNGIPDEGYRYLGSDEKLLDSDELYWVDSGEWISASEYNLGAVIYWLYRRKV